uniref:Multiple epidermal growth factor-like domains protein 10 n=1 Tax=Crassostrea virginica TaxID=6565 RepID=A0A8B8BSC1_CRAVI|nr:multiple epidermal growth factor-like domains protein 10 [Crassostrea virginica]XP_022306228.1 multiple epidermal growth factor-like domains protein 10 [Crassostrea virginica]
MGFHGTSWMVALGAFLSSCLLLYECRELYGYKFPVWSTKSCPKNEKDWDDRSSLLNCNYESYYTCCSNENFTELLEFCYPFQVISIAKGFCLFLTIRDSALNAFDCTGFQQGCPTEDYRGSTIYRYPSCVSLGNGCFLQEPSCKSNQARHHTVQSECPIPGFYGENCSIPCPQNCHCHITEGTCLGCLPGYVGTNCNKKCGKNMYGEECKQSCGSCSNGEPCHHVNGSCQFGCDAGVYGEKCDIECPTGRYGRSCYEKCGEQCQGCNRFSGVCELGCLPGWAGQRCEEPCTLTISLTKSLTCVCSVTFFFFVLLTEV